jgi:predicted transcriptional regulator
MSAIKDAVLELVQKLPDDCTWDDVMHQIYVRQKIEAGIKDADEGRLVPHEDVFKEWSE